MASTYSTNLGITLMTPGENSDTWGDITNDNLGTLLEQAISGYVTQSVATGTDTTITIPDGSTGVARNMYIELTGTGGAATNLIVPAKKKLYFIYNNTVSGQVTVKVSGQTGVSVENGKKVILVCDGTDVELATSYPTLPVAVSDGGTGQTSYTNGQLLIGNTTGNTLTKATDLISPSPTALAQSRSALAEHCRLPVAALASRRVREREMLSFLARPRCLLRCSRLRIWERRRR